MINDNIDPYDYRNTISKAACRAMGGRLENLYDLCDDQKTVSTNKLRSLVDELAESDRLDAIHFRVLAQKLHNRGTGESS